MKHNVCIYKCAKIVKGFENIFIKLLARKKRLCIFALGFGKPTNLQHLNKDSKNTKQ